MFIEEGMLIKATHDDGKSFTGTVYKIVVQPSKDDNNRPHALIFISQDKRFIEQEGEFGCASEWVDKLQSIKVLEPHTDYLDGAYYDSENRTATFGNEMFEEFRKFCIQETATFDVMKKTDINVVCRVDESVIDFFVKCMQSEKEETIRVLCTCTKEMLTMRLNGEHFEQPAEQWIERVGINLINEALKRYDDREFAVEREAMSELK